MEGKDGRTSSDEDDEGATFEEEEMANDEGTVTERCVPTSEDEDGTTSAEEGDEVEGDEVVGGEEVPMTVDGSDVGRTR